MSKQRRGVLVGLQKATAGKLKLTLDDVIQSGDEPSKWNQDVSITFKEYETMTFEQLAFSEKELADFGYMIVARLYAFFKQDEI
jgi:hypothetical protein